MAIPKYKDPSTGKWIRITTYGQNGNAVEIAEISGETALSDDIITELKNDLNWISYGGGAYRFVSFEEDKRLYSYITENKISQILVNTLTKTCALRETQITAASVADSIVKRDSYGEIPVSTPSRDSSATNKAYVDEADKDLRLKLSNLEQALNGYILDTTEEAYADLDSAVLKNSVAVGDNVYPIADKTRALVTRIEGKTTKMVQLLDKSKYFNTQTNSGITATNNGDGSWTINGTATADDYINFSPALSLNDGHKVLLTGNKTDSGFTLGLLNQHISDTGNGDIGIIKAGLLRTWGISWKSGAVINNVTITPQLFDLTAMNREDITSAEQFKAEFPEFYPYENGNIYPAKISGVKFYEKQDKSGEQASVTLPETYDLHGIGDYKDYLEITKNENNELYTLKKVQSVGVYEYTGNEAWTVGSDNFTSVFRYYCTDIIISKSLADKGICNKYATLTGVIEKEGVIFGSSNFYIYLFLNKTNFPDINSVKSYLSAQYAENNPVVIYYRLSSPVETVIATNLTYEQVTAIRHNGGLIEVVGNTNKAYAKPTIKNTVVYRLTATNTAEG